MKGQATSLGNDDFERLFSDLVELEAFGWDTGGEVFNHEPNSTLPQDGLATNTDNGSLATLDSPIGIAIAPHLPNSKRFTAAQRSLLDSWMDRHADRPYLTDSEELRQLVHQTALSEKQIRVYLANYRRRKFGNRTSSHGSHDAELSDDEQDSLEARPPSQRNSFVGNPSPTPSLRGSCIETRECYNDTPFGAWNGDLLTWYVHNLSSWASQSSYDTETAERQSYDIDVPEIEDMVWERPYVQTEAVTLPSLCAPLTSDSTSEDMLRMMSIRASPSHYRSVDMRRIYSNGGRVSKSGRQPARNKSRSFNNDRASVTSRNPSLSSMGGSSCSGGTWFSISSHASRGSRKGRRAYGTSKRRHESPFEESLGLMEAMQGNHLVCKATSKSSPYCGATFSRNFTLKRHISTKHEYDQTWMCRPVDLAEQGLYGRCPLCLEDFDGCLHVQTMHRCWARAPKDRTFFRSDAMRQHLQTFHGANKDKDLVISAHAMQELVWNEQATPFVEPMSVLRLKAKLIPCLSASLPKFISVLLSCWNETLKEAHAQGRFTSEPLPSYRTIPDLLNFIVLSYHQKLDHRFRGTLLEQSFSETIYAFPQCLWHILQLDNCAAEHIPPWLNIARLHPYRPDPQ